MPDPKPTDAYDENVEFKLKELSDWLQEQLPAGWGHTLLLHNVDGSGMLYYMTNIRREDLVGQLKQFISLMESKEGKL